MKEMGFRQDHIDTMQLDDIMIALQSSKGRELQAMGRVPSGFSIRPSHENVLGQITDWYQSYQPNTAQSQITPMGLFRGLPR